MTIFSQAHGIDNAHHMVPDTGSRSTAVIKDGFSIIDSYSESGSLAALVLLFQGIRQLSHLHRWL